MNKETKIIECLLNCNDWITADDLSLNLSIPKRSMQRYIGSINTEFNSLILSSREGYRLNKNVYANTSYSNFSENNRIHDLINRLMLCDKPLDVDDLADELFISVSTLRQSIFKVKSYISDFNLKCLLLFRGSNLIVKQKLIF